MGAPSRPPAAGGLRTLLRRVDPVRLVPRYAHGIDRGWFYRLNESFRRGGDSLGTAFPSSHVAGSATLAWVAWRCCARAVAVACTAAAAMILVAVVYTQNHFVVDAVAGLCLVIVVQRLVAPALLAGSVSEALSSQSAVRRVAPDMAPEPEV